MKNFFHLLAFSVLNSYILHRSCGSKLIQCDFKIAFVRDIIYDEAQESQPQTPHGTDQLFAPVNGQDILLNEHWRLEGR
jgi:hypothetical protein